MQNISKYYLIFISYEIGEYIQNNKKKNIFKYYVILCCKPKTKNYIVSYNLTQLLILKTELYRIYKKIFLSKISIYYIK